MNHIKNILTFLFYGSFFFLLTLFVSSHSDEMLHKKLFDIGNLVAPFNTGKEILNIQKDFFIGFPLITPNLDFWAPLIMQSLKYSFVFFIFLVLHRISGSVFLDPAGDSVIHDRRKLGCTIPMHVFHSIGYFGWHIGYLAGIYGLMGMFGYKCPTPLLRELISLLVAFSVFGMLIHEKTGFDLTPVFPKRFDTILLFLIFVEYQTPGKSIQFMNIIPFAYALWYYKIGQHRDRHFGIFFKNDRAPQQGDECYEAYRAHKKEVSLFFYVIEYVKSKIYNNKQTIN